VKLRKGQWRECNLLVLHPDSRDVGGPRGGDGLCSSADASVRITDNGVYFELSTTKLIVKSCVKCNATIPYQ